MEQIRDADSYEKARARFMNAVNKCPNCGSSTKSSFHTVPDRHYGIAGLFSYSKCISCELVFLDPMPDNEELMAYYPEDSYYSYNVEYSRVESTWKSFVRSILFMGYATKDPVFPTPGCMLDIGCGNGWFIHGARGQGWDVKGVEPSKAGAEVGRRVGGLDIHHGDLLSANYQDNQFDYIRSNHSFEHIPNPNEVLNEIYRILKPGGKVFIGVPNISSLNGSIFGPYWYYLGAPVHTFNYSSKTLPELIKRHQFKNIEVNYNSNYSGLLGSIQILLNRNNKMKSNEGFVANFFPFKIVAGFISKLSNLFRQGDCIEVIFEK